MSDGRRIWVVSELYYPERTSTGHVVTELAEALALHDSVHVLCGQPTYAERGRRAAATEQRQGVTITRCAGTTFDKDRLLLRVINMITLGVSMLAAALRLFRRGDVVLVLTTPPILPFLMFAAARWRRAATVLVIHDLYPDAAVAAGLLAADGRATSLIRRAHAWLYARVDGIAPCGRDMRDLVLERVPASRSGRVVVVPNWADPLPAERPEQNALLRRLSLQDRFVLLHAGNMGRVQAIEPMVEAARRLATTNPKVHFLFIGNGSKRVWLERTIAEAGLSNITVLDHKPREEQAEFLNACHVAILGFVPGMKGVGVPSRMYNALAVGRPLIAMVDAGAEPALVIEEQRVGWVVKPHDVDGLVDVIQEAAANTAEREAMGRRARTAALGHFSLAHTSAAVRGLIDGITQRR